MANTFKNAIHASIDTTPVVCYTAPALTATTVIGMSVANITTSDAFVTVTLTDISQSKTGHVGKDTKIPARGTLVVIGSDQKVVLEAGDYITVVATAGEVDVILSVLEVA